MKSEEIKEEIEGDIIKKITKSVQDNVEINIMNKKDLELLVKSQLEIILPERSRAKKIEDEKLRLAKIAREIARLFPYEAIVSANLDDPLVSEVHGFLQQNYEDYEELIKDNYILDRACYFARKDFKPRPLRIISKIDLEKYVITAIEFDREYILDRYPHQAFKKAVFFAEEYLEKSIDWEDGVDWLIDNFPTNVILGRANIILIDWIMDNVPAFLVSHAPLKDYAVYNLNINKDSIAEQTSKVRKTIIHELQKREDPLLEKIDKLERGERQWRRGFTELKDEREIERTYNIDKIMKNALTDEWTGGNREKKGKTSDIVLMIILIIILGLLAVFMLSGGFGGNMPDNSTLTGGF